MVSGDSQLTAQDVRAAIRADYASHLATTTSNSVYALRSIPGLKSATMAAITAQHFVENAAVFSISDEQDLRAAFRQLDVTENILIESSTPFAFGGQSDILRGDLLILHGSGMDPAPSYASVQQRKVHIAPTSVALQLLTAAGGSQENTADEHSSTCTSCEYSHHAL